MHLPSFAYQQPTDLDEVVTALQEGDSKILAGGTDLLVNMKHRVEAPATLVSLSRVQGLVGIREEAGAVVIGARTTLKAVQTDPLIAARFPALVQAAMAVGSYRHQTMGTLGGNLCQNTRCRFFNQSLEWRQARPICYKAGGEECQAVHKKAVCYAAYCGDVAPALLVLEARIRTRSAQGVREFPLEELYSGEGRAPLALAPGEIVTEVVIPADSASPLCRYEKASLRGAIDFPVVGVAVWIKDGSVRVAYTAVNQAPVRARQLEAELQGLELSELAIQSAVEAAGPLAGKAARVYPTTTYSASQKRELMAGLLAKNLKALARAAATEGSES